MFLLAASTALVLAAAQGGPPSTPAGAASCAETVRARERVGVLPPTCRILMGVRLDSSIAEVVRRYGRPDAVRRGPGDELTAGYVFPRATLRQRPKDQAPPFGVLYVTYVAGRVAAIRSPVGLADPAISFGELRVGDPVRKLSARFGPAEHVNRSHDAYFFLPLPVVVDVDPEASTVDGFEIAASPDRLGSGGNAALKKTWDPATSKSVYSLSFEEDR